MLKNLKPFNGIIVSDVVFVLKSFSPFVYIEKEISHGSVKKKKKEKNVPEIHMHEKKIFP